MSRRDLVAWLAGGAILVGAGIANEARRADAGTPQPAVIAAIISDRTGTGHPTPQHDPRHTSVGVRRSPCQGDNLRVVPTKAGRYALVVSVTTDGWLGDRGYAAHARSSQGGRVLVSFTQQVDGAIRRASCAEVFGHPEANVHFVGVRVPR